MLIVVAPLVAQAACRNPNQDVMVIRAAQPGYPESARQLGLGVVAVTVKVTIAPDGRVLGVTIFQSAGNMALDQAALSAARQSVYSPEVVNCQPVTSDYLFRATFDPAKGASFSSPPPGPPPLPVPSPSAVETCETQAMAASQAFAVLEPRRDFVRALQAASDAANVQTGCAAKIKTPERFSLDMLAGSTLSRAADLAFRLGRLQQARSFATRANSIYSSLTAPSLDQNYARFLTPNAKANIQANNDLLQRIARQEQCVGDSSAPIVRVVYSQMPAGTSVPRIAIAGKYALAIAYGPDGYAVRSFLLVNQSGWKIRASEGGAFDLTSYKRNGVPATIADKLSTTVACTGR